MLKILEAAPTIICHLSQIKLPLRNIEMGALPEVRSSELFLLIMFLAEREELGESSRRRKSFISNLDPE